MLWCVISLGKGQQEFLDKGKVTEVDIRPVVISGMTDLKLADVVENTRQSLMDVEATYGFDLHFTLGDSYIIDL